MSDTYIGVNGVARKVNSMYVGVDGVARKVTKGYIGVDGIARQFYSSNYQASALSIGDTIEFGMFNNNKLVWYVADKDYYSTVEANVTLVCTGIYTTFCFDAGESSDGDHNYYIYGRSDYDLSTIRMWLNSESSAGRWYKKQHDTDAKPNNEYAQYRGFLNQFSQKEIDSIIPVTIRGKNSTGEYTCLDRVYIPSVEEIGLSGTNHLSLFSNSNYLKSFPIIPDLNRDTYWLRDGDDLHYAKIYDENYSIPMPSVCNNYVMGVRPVCTIKANTPLSSDPNANGNYSVV